MVGHTTASWQTTVDWIVDRSLRRVSLPLADRIPLAKVAVSHINTVPACSLAHDLYSLVIRKYLGITSKLIFPTDIQHSVVEPDIYTIGRITFFEPEKIHLFDIHSIASGACVSLNLGDHHRAIDALFVIANFQKCDDALVSKEILRFYQQAKLYLRATSNCFPDQYVVRVQNWIETVDNSDR